MPVVGSVFEKPLDDDVYGIQNALAIIVSGDTAPSALSPGKYIYLINHSTIRSGLYRIISAIASGDTIVSTDIEVPTDGIINDLIEADDAKVNKTDIVDNLTTNDSTKVLSAAQGYALNSNVTPEAITPTSPTGVSIDSHACYKIGKIVVVNVVLTVTSASAITSQSQIFKIPGCKTITSTPVVGVGNLGAGGKQALLVNDGNDAVVNNNYDGYDVANKKYFFNFSYVMP